MGELFVELSHGRSVIIGSQETQIYQRFAGSRQEGFILKIQNDENNAAQQDNGRRFHINCWGVYDQVDKRFNTRDILSSIEFIRHTRKQFHSTFVL